MIVIARGYGQLGNRLFLYAHMIAAARHYGTSVANPCFAEYAHLFPATKRDLWCRYSPEGPVEVKASQADPSLKRRKRLARSVHWAARSLHLTGFRRYPLQVLRIRGSEVYDLCGDDFASRVANGRHLLALGWLFRSETLLYRHADAIRDHLSIGVESQQNVNRKIAEIRQQSDFVVGVHIRHGDYATFLNGKYYYTTAQYVRAMHEVAEQLPGKRVSFLVCSNSPLHRHDFDNLNVHFGPGQIIEDMYCFAEADLLMGPPSTYTGWASFYGDVPLVVMEGADQPIRLAEFTRQRAA